MSVRQSLVYSFMDRYAGLALGIASSMAIARLLTPTEVGIFSVVMALLALVTTVRDLGAGQYLLQQKDLTNEQVKSVWAVQLGLGSLLALLALAASWPAAHFYRDPRIQPIMALLALNYLINPIGSITYAWLMREMRFGALAWGRFSGSLLGAVVSVGLAWAGYGPISLAWGSLASTVANAIVLSAFRPQHFPWLPGLRHVREVLAFGSRLTGASVLTTIAAGAPEFFLARLQSLAAAGFYSRANGLIAMFRSLVSDAVNAVSLPFFAKAARDKRDLPEAFTRVQAYMTAVGWSFCLVALVLAYPLIRVLYGDQWDAAVPLARWLALAMLFQIPVGTCHTALVSTGAAHRLLRSTAWQSLFVLLAVALGAGFSLEVLAAAMVPAAAFSLVVWLWQVQAHLGLNLRSLVASQARSAGVAVCSALGPIGCVAAMGLTPTQTWLQLMLAIPLAALGFVLGCLLLRHPLANELQGLWAKLRRRR